MECSHARLLLLFTRPPFERPGQAQCTELTSEDITALQSHLEQCGACRRLAQRDRLTDEALGPAIRAVPVPDGLQRQIMKRLDRQRGSWVRTWSMLAALAACLLALGLGVWFYGQPGTPLGLDNFFEGSQRSGPVTAAAIEEWYRKQGVAMIVPSEPELHKLDSWETAVVKGKRVARLLYWTPGGVAHVYVIPKQYVDDDFRQQVSGRSAEGIDLRDENGFVILTYFTGSRDGFRMPQQ